jgi:Holliday junction resolvase
MLEKDFQKQVLKLIRTGYDGVWAYKASDKLISGVPDIIGCVGGRMFAIELKVGKNKPTELQNYTIGKMRESGANVIVAYDLDTVKRFMEEELGCQQSIWI